MAGNTMKKKHFNIPIFIPELACPFQCLYCNQQKISGQQHLPSDEEITTTIEKYLETIPEGSAVQLAYFGGNFSGISLEEQEHYLKLVKPYIENGSISGIRISTRPDYINEEILSLLKKYKVVSIELGAQSMKEEVLKQSKRGHTAFDTKTASRLIINHGIELGLQMMIGLPGDTLNRSLYTAKRIIELGAANTRIYPTLVIKDTALEKMYNDNMYKPLELEEAIRWSKELFQLFEKSNVKVLKLGLHPSDGLVSGEDLVAGPFHRSFRELVLTEIWADILSNIQNGKSRSVEISIPQGEINYAIGYRAKNKKELEKNFKVVRFREDKSLINRNFIINYDL